MVIIEKIRRRNMKSPMVENAEYIKDKEKYSELQILRSGAGYYIGTLYMDPGDGRRSRGVEIQNTSLQDLLLRGF